MEMRSERIKVIFLLSWVCIKSMEIAQETAYFPFYPFYYMISNIQFRTVAHQESQWNYILLKMIKISKIEGISFLINFQTLLLYCIFYRGHFAQMQFLFPQLQQFSKMERPIDLPKLKYMIRDGIARIPKDPNADQAVIVIGDTGVGKSTILAFLSGEKLQVKYDGLKPILDCAQKQKIKIGHEKYSETSVPNKILIDNLAFYDCPGFRDNKGQEYEISNSFFVQRLLDIYPKVKIVLLIDESHVSQARADKLPRLTKNLLKSFKTFQDIQEGVTMIINRAERDLNVLDYHREIRKMCELRNDNESLFGEEEENFLKFLINNNRIMLFKQPKKEDKNKNFVPTDTENSILRTIKYSSFVRSKHILNILSESAKLAIRDFIDQITEESNSKIQILCSEIVSRYTMKVTKKGKDIQGLLDLKQQVITLAEEVKMCQKQKIVDVLQREVPKNLAQDFSEDFAAVMFFKGIYDKTYIFFSNLVNKIYTELSHLLVKMDNRILKVQKDEQQQMERKRQFEKKRELEDRRQKNQMEIMQKIRKMESLKRQVDKLHNTNKLIDNSIDDELECLQRIQNQAESIRVGSDDLETANCKILQNLCTLQNQYIKNAQF